MLSKKNEKSAKLRQI